MVLLEELIREATWSRGSPCLLVPAAHLVCCVLQQFCLSFWPLDTRDVESQRGNTIPTCIQHQFGVFYRLRQSLRMIAKFDYYPFLVWTVFERCLVAFAETMISFKQLPLALVVLAARPYQSSSARCFDLNNSLSNTMPAATVNILDNASELGDISLGSGVPRTWEGICLRVSAPLLSCFWNGTHSSDKDVVAMGRYVSMRAVDVATMATMRTSCFQVIKNEGPISEAAEGHAFLIFVGPLVKIAVARVICHLFSEYMLLHQIIQKGFLTAPPKWERRRRRRAEFSEFGRRAYDEFGADIHKKLEAVRDEPSEKVNSGDTTPINTELEKNSKMQDIVDKALDKFNQIMEAAKNTLSKKYSSNAFFSHRTDHCIRLASSMVLHPISQLALFHVFLVSSTFMINVGGDKILNWSSVSFAGADLPHLIDKFLHHSTSAFSFLSFTFPTDTSEFWTTVNLSRHISTFSAVRGTLLDMNAITGIIHSTLGSIYCFIGSIGKPAILLATSTYLRSYIAPKVAIYFTNCCFGMLSYIESSLMHRYDFDRCGGEAYLTGPHRNSRANSGHRASVVSSEAVTRMSNASMSRSDIMRVSNKHYESTTGCGVTSCVFPVQSRPVSQTLSLIEQVSWRRTIFEQMCFTIEGRKTSIVAQMEICEEMANVVMENIEPVGEADVDECCCNNVVVTYLSNIGDSPLGLSPIQKPTDRGSPFVNSIRHVNHVHQKSNEPLPKKEDNKGNTIPRTKSSKKHQSPLNRTETELASAASVDAAVKFDVDSLMKHAEAVLGTASQATHIVTLHFEERTIVKDDALMLKKTVNELNACLESIERIEQKLAHRLHFYDSITARQQRVTMRRAILFRTISDVVGGIVAQFPLYTVSMLLEVRAISYVIGMQSSNIVSMGQFSSAPHNSESVDFSSSSTSYLSVAKKTIVNVYAKIIAYGVRPIGAFIYSEYLCLNGALRYMGNQPIVNPGGYTPLHESDPNKLSDLMNAPHLTDIGLIWHGFRAKILSPLIPLFTGCLFEYKRLIINRVLLTEWRLDRHEKLINEEEQKEIMSEANENHDPPIPRS